MAGNGGEGFDHACTENKSHATWDPNRWRIGERCHLYHLGEQCKGTLFGVGKGSVKANAAHEAAEDAA